MPRRVGSSDNRRPHFIREWREKRGLSLDALAALMRTSKGHLSDIENLKTAYRQDLLELCADALGTDVGSLLMVNPLVPNPDEPILGIWRVARPDQRDMIIDLAQTVVKRQ